MLYTCRLNGCGSMSTLLIWDKWHVVPKILTQFIFVMVICFWPLLISWFFFYQQPPPPEVAWFISPLPIRGYMISFTLPIKFSPSPPQSTSPLNMHLPIRHHGSLVGQRYTIYFNWYHFYKSCFRNYFLKVTF